MSESARGTHVPYSAGQFLTDAECFFHSAVANSPRAPEGRELAVLSQSASLLVIAQLIHRGVTAIEGQRADAALRHAVMLDAWRAEMAKPVRLSAAEIATAPTTAPRTADASDLVACATIARQLFGKATSAGHPSRLDGELARKFLSDFVEAMQHVADESCA